MLNEELPDSATEQAENSVSSEATEFGELFFKLLRLEYTDAAIPLSASATQADFQRAMAEAICRVFAGFTPSVESVARLLNEALLKPAGAAESTWSIDENSRRLVLVDKYLQRTITPTEMMELAQLTARMRAHFDREEFVPLEGARRLHRSLSTAAKTEGRP